MESQSAVAQIPERPLRVLVIDKVSVLRSIRERHQRLAERANLDLILLAPTMWVENFVRIPFEPTANEPFRNVLGKVVWPGKEQRSFYHSGMFSAFRLSRPEIILMMEE